MIVSGFDTFYKGNSKKEHHPPSMFLRTINVEYISNEQCESWWKKINVTEAQLCTSSVNKGVCM